MASDDELVAAYWTHERLASSTDRPERLKSDEWFWAWDDVHERTFLQPTIEDAVPLIVRLVDAAPKGREGYIGAGPIENLLTACGASAVDAIEAAARKNAGVARALASVDWPENLSASDIERLSRFHSGRDLN